MKKIVTISALAAGLFSVTPVFAQGVYLGPGGVGVDVGPRYHRDYDRRDDYRRYNEDEGRSVYRYHDRRDRYDDDN